MMKEKYVGKTIEVYTPSGRFLHRGKVLDVLEDNVIHLAIEGADIETAVYLSDGIQIKIIEPIEDVINRDILCN
jgi:hypothetical protein